MSPPPPAKRLPPALRRRPRSKSRNISKKFADEIYRCDHSKRNRPGHFDCGTGMRVRYVKDLNTSSEALIQTRRKNWHKRFKDIGLSSPVKQSIEANHRSKG
uniref:Uncharacterized protein n=1 Tax=Ditylenchus dipsaci TaxID=166011 RepID=A0A915DU07_9BILA